MADGFHHGERRSPIRSRIARPGRRSADIQGELAKLLGPGAVAPATTAYLTDAAEAPAASTAGPTRSPCRRRRKRWRRSSPTATSATSRSCPRGGGLASRGGPSRSRAGSCWGSSASTHVRSLDPELWRMHVEAGGTPGRVHRLARENGLQLPARPGGGGAVAHRRQHRHQRGRPARLQVRRHRRLGHRAGGRARAGRAGDARRGRSARTSRATTSCTCSSARRGRSA